MKKIIVSIVGIFIFSTAFSQLNITELGNLTYTQDLNDIWGYVDSTGKEYALIGVQNGLSVVDISDPTSPTEVHLETGISSTWRDIKTWNKHAYVTTEGGGGLLKLDLSSLPDALSITSSYYSGVNYPFSKAHNIYIDENGIAYIFGANFSEGGAIMLDLNNDTIIELGFFDAYYLHDGMVRGDTLWGSAINDGVQIVVDVSDKSNPIVLADWATPNNFSHNCWVSDDGNYLYTTDEKQGAYIGAYDVSDLNNVTEVDKIQSNPGTGTIPHNSHFMNNYVITSYYNDGVTVHDVSVPSNMVEVANFDSESNFAGNDNGGFNGAWGAYPFLPSGNLIISDINNGLFVLGVQYTRACFLDGIVSDSICGENINNVKIEIINNTATDFTDISGTFAFGFPTSGTYDVKFSKAGYQSKTYTGIQFINGQTVNFDVKLYSANTVSVTGNIGNLSGATVQFQNINNTYNFTTDAQGNYSKCNIIPDNYNISISKWGYQTKCLENVAVSSSNSTLNFSLQAGYYDDFSTNLNWTITGDASTGAWERGVPVGTTGNNGEDANPGTDASNSDCDGSAYITGNGGGSAWNDDIDNGNTILTSQPINLTFYQDPYLSFYTWFYTADGSGYPFNDYLQVAISNGTDTVELVYADTASTMSQWEFHNFKVSDYITKTNNMNLIVTAVDDTPGHIVEAGFDVFSIVDSSNNALAITENKLENKALFFPNPFSNQLNISLNQSFDNVYVVIYDVTGKTILTKDFSASSNLIQLHTNFSRGMYYVAIYSNSKLIGKEKLIKN